MLHARTPSASTQAAGRVRLRVLGAQRAPSLLLACVFVACGSTQATSGSTTPHRSELVIDEPTVVSARPRLREGELPPLPQPLESSPESFRRAHALASALLAAEGPGAVPVDDAAHAEWSRLSFASWLQARSGELQAVVDAFEPARTGSAAERVVAAALVGLGYTRLHAQFTSVPPPASVAADARLTRVYRSALDAQAGAFLEQGSAALAHCAQHASAQTEAAFGLWLQLCQEQRVKVLERASQAKLLAELVAAERKADQIAAEGARPPGPEVCWTAERVEPSAADATPSTMTTAAAATDSGVEAAPARRCARSARAEGTVSTTEPAPSPRDLRYGLRDAATAVRVSAALADADTMDASPLLQPAPRSALAACFAQHVRVDQPVTVAVHATLVVDARGKARSAALTPEPSDAASPPSPALVRCLQRALVRVPFDCSPSGQETQTRVTYCLRRD